MVAALAYTGGPWPYGYRGLGEVFVFAFFGLVAVVGTAYLQAGRLEPPFWLAGFGSMTADQESATGVVTLAPFAGANGAGAGGADGGGGGGGELTVHPDRVATRGVAEPSSTSTVQSAGAV